MNPYNLSKDCFVILLRICEVRPIYRCAFLSGIWDVWKSVLLPQPPSTRTHRHTRVCANSYTQAYSCTHACYWSHVRIQQHCLRIFDLVSLHPACPFFSIVVVFVVVVVVVFFKMMVMIIRIYSFLCLLFCSFVWYFLLLLLSLILLQLYLSLLGMKARTRSLH